MVGVHTHMTDRIDNERDAQGPQFRDNSLRRSSFPGLYVFASANQYVHIDIHKTLIYTTDSSYWESLCASTRRHDTRYVRPTGV